MGRAAEPHFGSESVPGYAVTGLLPADGPSLWTGPTGRAWAGPIGRAGGPGLRAQAGCGHTAGPGCAAHIWTPGCWGSVVAHPDIR